MKTLSLEAKLENIPKVTEFIDLELEALDCPMKAQMEIDIMIDEIFGNIVNYAYGDDSGPVTVQFETCREPLSVIITFEDQGIPFDPLTTEEPDVTLSADQRKIGGLGIFIVKKTMDKVDYEYRDGRNILKVKKILRK